MSTLRYKEKPLFDVKTNDILKMYDFLYSFFLFLRHKKGDKVTRRHKAAVDEPGWASAEILYMSLYGVKKKTKYSKQTKYLTWKNAPKSLQARIMNLLGPEGKSYLIETDRSQPRPKREPGVTQETPQVDQHVNHMSYTLRTDDIEIQTRMQKYIEDFDLHSAVDIDILRNLVQTQLLIELAHKALSEGKHTTQDLKSLSQQLKDYALLLGLSKKDRIDLGAERKKGSIAELASTYEETLREYPELEREFLIDELNMLLDKHERLDDDGESELALKAFRVISGGYTLEEARSITGRKRKNVKQKRTPNS